ncbi:MAG TPA: pyridoxal-phosphate dependent enzyme [Armatimonadetes bacterium]|nr:pyridoxal-phosphate dependent enzyme [Armatimonadota bacterium]
MRSVTEERKKFLMTYGAKIRLTDPLEETEGAIREAERLAKENPERYFRPDQYNNPANPKAHYETTGPEIWRQTKGRITHFVAGVGTGGTISGAGRRLKELNPDIEVIAVEPAEPLHGIAGLKFISPETKPGVYDESVVDRKIFVHIGQSCETSLRLAREEGLLVGHSAGAAMWAALKVAEEIEEGVIVVILPDSGDRYLSMGWGLK